MTHVQRKTKHPSPPQPPRVYLSLDVESDGPAPGLYSMISFGLVDVDNPTNTFYAQLRPISDDFIPEALAVSGFTREQALQFPHASEEIKRLGEWVHAHYPNCRVTIVSDNPAFDWQFINYYTVKFLGKNPFGHSARRIGDVWAGMEGNFSNDSGWKRLRVQKHTHNALDDALGNAQALQTMRQTLRQKSKPPKPSM